MNFILVDPEKYLEYFHQLLHHSTRLLKNIDSQSFFQINVYKKGRLLNNYFKPALQVEKDDKRIL
ncbi:hypothetical protein WQ57_21110 [Mesobacillus campisalis]|uniref:Uncharacterized protein n=1 Tax=Mesobacillus campisalis TaxID=1408103 RepID=A0A0M2ST04_9BACI|nr:hypothetical protein WQ57_21110 [Mesobacillus campisalis]